MLGGLDKVGVVRFEVCGSEDEPIVLETDVFLSSMDGLELADEVLMLCDELECDLDDIVDECNEDVEDICI